MSLLMDALKKAEREKSRAASKKRPEEQTGSDPSSEAIATDQTIPDSESSFQQPLNQPEKAPQVQEDGGWAFDTSELELEPLAHQDHQSAALADDTTMAEPLPPEEEKQPDTTGPVSTSDPEFDKSGFDHDVTLPSERAIQSSLKDYFEESQSITLDQSEVGTSESANVTQQSVINTSPLDVSSTHVTAHTIFTASQVRKPSTGLASYALFGTIFLALGLGATALYYSYVTPSVINMPTAPTTVATMVEPDEQSQSVQVDVNTAEANPPFEPGTSVTAVTTEDPVLAQVVKEDLSTEVAQTKDKKAANSREKTLEPNAGRVENTSESSLQKVAQTEEETATAAKKTRSGIKETKVATSELPSIEHARVLPVIPPPAPKPKHEVVYFPQHETMGNHSATERKEEAIVLAEKKQESQILQGGSEPFVTQANNQPIDVASAEDLAKGLRVPKSAIKITKGHTGRATSTDLTLAWRAYQNGDYETAKELYRKILNNRPDNRDARLGIAAIAVLEGNYETAYRHYQYLLQLNPRDELVNAALFNLQGNSSGIVSESQLKLLLDQNPDSSQLYFSLGSYYAGQLRWPDAQQAFFEAFNLDQENPDYAYNLAVSLDHMGQSKSALDYYRKALKLANRKQVSFNTSKVLARIQKLSGIVKN